VLALRQHRDAQLTMYVLFNCDLGAHAPMVPRRVSHGAHAVSQLSA
jgi:hypothetical protein